MHLAINAYFWNRPFTGSGQYTRQLVYHLNRYISDLDITLILPQLPGEPAPEQIPPSVRVHLVPLRPGPVGKVWFEQIAFPRVCRAVGADLAHVPYWGGPLQSPIPHIITVHDLTTLLVREYRRPAKTRLYNALVTASARGADHVITDSQASQQEIVQHFGLPETAVTPIYLGVNSTYKPSQRDLLEMAILRKYNLPDSYVLYLGGYELHKNIITLLLAYTYVAQALGEEYPLILAGRKPERPSDIYPDYDEYIRQLRLEKHVRWIGYVDEADKPTLYRQAELFVFPSRREGFGLPPLEAMACGVPVVTTDATSLPEIVGDAAFAVDPDNEKDMAGAIIACLVQDNLAADLRVKGQQQAAGFTWQKTATETAVLYDRILHRQPL